MSEQRLFAAVRTKNVAFPEHMFKFRNNGISPLYISSYRHICNLWCCHDATHPSLGSHAGIALRKFITIINQCGVTTYIEIKESFTQPYSLWHEICIINRPVEPVFMSVRSLHSRLMIAGASLTLHHYPASPRKPARCGWPA